MAREVKMTIAKERCKGCSLCVHFCDRKVLTLGDEINELGYNPITITDLEKCNGCAICFRMCPDLVFEIERVNKN